MIPLLALALAAVAPQASCPELLTPGALVCRALDAQARGDFAAAAQGFEEAAKAGSDKDPAVARAYAAAGNMWIAANEPGKAALDLDQALSRPGLEAEQRGEALLDRARAAAEQNDLRTARAKLSEAAATIAEDPFYWYVSASLAIRENDAATAKAAIGKALVLAPNDPTILFEAGHVAQFTGDEAAARNYWRRAAALDRGGEIGRRAAKDLEMLGVAPTVKIAPQPTK